MIKFIRRALTVFLAVTLVSDYIKSTDSYIRRAVVQIQTLNGGCTGIQVMAPSRKVYILTAGHCQGLLINGHATAIDSNGKEHDIKMVEADPEHDLMIMTAINQDDYINIARESYKNEHIRTITHGNMLPTYTTEGELLEDQIITVPLFNILTESDRVRCRKMGNTDIAFNIFFGELCMVKFQNTIGTAWVVPGSSGGPVVDDRGLLVGIVSTSNGDHFAGYVPLRHIIGIMKDK